MRFSSDLSLIKTNHVNHNRYKMMQQHIYAGNRWIGLTILHSHPLASCPLHSKTLRPIVIPKQMIKNGTISHLLIPETYMSVVNRKTMFYAQP